MDVVIQGKIFPGTYDTAKCYTTLDFIDNVIISTWDDETIESEHDKNSKITRSIYTTNES